LRQPWVPSCSSSACSSSPGASRTSRAAKPAAAPAGCARPLLSYKVERMESRTRLRVALFLAVGMTTTGLALLAYGSHLIAPGSGWDVFGGAELSSIDRRFAIRGRQSPPKNLVVVKIDDTTFSELGARWPFRRSIHAHAIRNLKAAGAKVIAYDIQFSEFSPGRQGILDDNAFMDASHAAGNLVYSTTEVSDRGQGKFLGGAQGIGYG